MNVKAKDSEKDHAVPAVGDEIIIRGTVSEVHPGGNLVITTSVPVDAYPEGSRINVHFSQVEAEKKKSHSAS